jgi:hypothetical protein
MPAELNPDQTALLSWADKLEARFRTLIEFGLIGANDQANSVLAPLTAGRKLARSAHVDDAAESLDRAELALQSALYSRSWLWRSWHIHQAGLFVYDVAALIVLLNIASGYFSCIAPTLWGWIPVPIAAVVAGGLGAILRGLWFLWLQVSKGVFRAQFTLAQLAAPWVGMLFGLFVYLLLKAGLLAVKGGESAKLEDSALPLALAFLAGYSWEWILGRIDQIKAATSAAPAQSPKPPGPPPPAKP